MHSLLLAAVLAFAQPPDIPDAAEAERLEREQQAAAERAREAAAQAEAVAREIALLQRQLIDLGNRVDASESAALASETELQSLASEEAEILARLDQNRDTLIDILAAIQRVESQTPPAVLASPGDAAEAARAAALMADVTPGLRQRAEALAAELDSLRDVRVRIESERDTLSLTEATLAEQRLELEVLISERRALEARRRNEAEDLLSAATTAGQQAASIRNLLGELAAMAEVIPRLSPQRAPPEGEIPTPRMRPAGVLVAAAAPEAPLERLRFADARGRLRPPAIGTIARRYGQVDEDGTPSEGIFIRTRSRAQVVSPFDGQVEFAGPFNTYGGLLILNVGDGYYIVLAGMSVTYATAGQNVLAGEPVGAMPDTGQTAPELYLELRRGGNAVDPGPWLRRDAQSG
jgi:septal ring factor EnvC (AmiA/AmiB activator)